MMNAVSSDIRHAVTDGIHLFFDLVDHGQASRTATLFTADASLTFGPGSPNPGTITGEAIATAMAAREKQASAFTRHVVSNIMFDAENAKGVSVRYLLVLFRSDDDSRDSKPAFVADVRERWSQREGSWKIAERIVNPAFIRAQF
ncbi:nuclear transport factor 2 family protein [Sphingobium phenoxybenzoativorans]|jgi:hypothetical protein|uniref:Nuclear transport factor 2 family protein n=1 Tax=Sphingobium phenoxybenzoativorans TaxID=1592790 RepID=A0A975K9C3_9SPHN|nr:nuclear transport factor 2 family protein [Sphingobium phenoxybenzoativorans]QUT07201.1 nuclear transport factor 2 family protein [Sphingobium phenoxybenzoativorans]